MNQGPTAVVIFLVFLGVPLIWIGVQAVEATKVAKRLAKTVRDPKTPSSVKEQVVAALAKAGQAGLDLLAEIGAGHSVSEAVRSQALEAVAVPYRR